MKPDENDIDLIERFLDGSLNEPELIEFHKRVEMDPDFANLLELRKKLPDLWQKANLYEEIQGEVRRSITMSLHHRIFQLHPAVYAIAASVIVLVGIGIAFILWKGGGDGLNQNNQVVVKQSDSILQLQTEMPGSKAKLDTVTKHEYTGTRLILLYPPDGMIYHYSDTVTFKWSIPGDSVSTFYVADKLNGDVLIKKRVNPYKPEPTGYLLPGKSLKPGTYIWYVDTNRVQREIRIEPDDIP